MFVLLISVVIPMGLSRKLALVLLLATSPFAHAESFNDGLIQDAWAADELQTAINQELSALDARKAATVAAYNQLGAKLGVYNGWCSTYGLTALRQIIEGRMYGKIFSYAAYPVMHIYSNDPYFQPARQRVAETMDQLRTTRVDIGKCALTEDMLIRMGRDPRHFDPTKNESAAGASHPYSLLAGNIRLIEEERALLLELRGVILGSRARNDDTAVEAFVAEASARLKGKTLMLRARTLNGYEFGFRVPLGALEIYNNKKIGHAETDQVPNFFWIFERRAFYVNQARVAAGKLFEVSVDNYTHAEKLQERFLAIIAEAEARK